MKKWLFLIAIGVGAWWYFIGGRTLSEDHVREFYAKASDAFLKRQPDKMCELLADKFELKSEVNAGSLPQSFRYNKAQTCAHYAETFELFDALGQKMGGMMHLDYAYNIDNIRLSSDKKTALVDYSYTLRVGGKLMQMHGSSVDTLVRMNGQTLALRSVAEEQAF